MISRQKKESRKQFQMQVIQRDRYCRIRNCQTPKLGLSAHHLLGKGGGGSDVTDNGITLCCNHHVPGVHTKGVGWLVANVRQQPGHDVTADADGELYVNGVLLKSFAMRGREL